MPLRIHWFLRLKIKTYLLKQKPTQLDWTNKIMNLHFKLRNILWTMKIKIWHTVMPYQMTGMKRNSEVTSIQLQRTYHLWSCWKTESVAIQEEHWYNFKIRKSARSIWRNTVTVLLNQLIHYRESLWSHSNWRRKRLD